MGARVWIRETKWARVSSSCVRPKVSSLGAFPEPRATAATTPWDGFLHSAQRKTLALSCRRRDKGTVASPPRAQVYTLSIAPTKCFKGQCRSSVAKIRRGKRIRGVRRDKREGDAFSKKLHHTPCVANGGYSRRHDESKRGNPRTTGQTLVILSSPPAGQTGEREKGLGGTRLPLRQRPATYAPQTIDSRPARSS